MHESIAKTFWRQQRLLVVTPHADDEIFGCAGLMAKIKDHGGEVYVICMTVADLAQYDMSVDVVSGQTRSDEFFAGMKALGVDDAEIMYTDEETHLRLDKMGRRDLIHDICLGSRLGVDRIKPTMVALPSISYNQDHEAVFLAGFTACRPHTGDNSNYPKTVLAYDSPTHFWNIERDKFHPNFYVDISDYVDVKRQALECHASQLRPAPHYLSFEMLERMMFIRGHEICVTAAEAFCAYRLVM
ncbi:MAG: PIG-L family deacetylase [Verrucomicrobia bacterium]|nr:PIG-L family deacetylase [Verrucomicrobiota bacterium]MDA1087301.1 PIG-L family deacetylase [Verrucomicrobiota bacterium]